MVEVNEEVTPEIFMPLFNVLIPGKVLMAVPPVGAEYHLYNPVSPPDVVEIRNIPLAPTVAQMIEFPASKKLAGG